MQIWTCVFLSLGHRHPPPVDGSEIAVEDQYSSDSRNPGELQSQRNDDGGQRKGCRCCLPGLDPEAAPPRDAAESIGPPKAQRQRKKPLRGRACGPSSCPSPGLSSAFVIGICCWPNKDRDAVTSTLIAALALIRPFLRDFHMAERVTSSSPAQRFPRRGDGVSSARK